MFRFRCTSGISDYKNIFNAILFLKWLFSCIFQSIAFYISYKMGRLRGLKSKLLIDKMIKMQICCKIGGFRFEGRLWGLKI